MTNKIDIWQRVGVLLAIKGDKANVDEMSLSLDGVSTILARFPDVSAEWLMRGTGSMYLHLEGETSATYNLDVSRHNVEGSGNVLSTGQTTCIELIRAVDGIAKSVERIADAVCRQHTNNDR